MNMLKLILTTAALASLPLSSLTAQEDPNSETETRIRRDQHEILRKAQRLQELMTNLQKRFIREGRTEQAELLVKGLEHLGKVGLLDDVASVRGNLETGAMNKALRKQEEVIAKLEQLIDILLDRRSVENLDEQIQQSQQLVQNASELLARQTELQRRSQAARKSKATPGEQALTKKIDELSRAVQREAEASKRNAGLRRPSLENALADIKKLLEQQKQLEESVAEQLSGNRKTQTRTRRFDLGDLRERQQDLLEQRGESRELDRLAKEAEDLKNAIDSKADKDSVRKARDRVRTRLSTAAATEDPALNRSLEPLREALEKLAADAQSSDEELSKLSEQIRDRAKASAKNLDKKNTAVQKKLAKDTADLQKQLEQDRQAKGEAESKKSNTEKNLAAAQEQMTKAAEAEEKSDVLAATSRALRKLAAAMKSHRNENPDAATQAAEMAAKADQTARGLRASPGRQDAEKRAAKELDQAEKALRDAADKIAEASDDKPPSEAIKSDLKDSRDELEKAKAELEKALSETNAGKESQQAAALARQQELEAKTKELAKDIDQAMKQGDISKEQAKSASSAAKKASQKMSQASKSAKSGSQSKASEQQRDASEQLDKAKEAIEKNRPVSEEERDALSKLADEQKKLKEDIIRLAEETKKRQNKAAEEALSEAADAAERAEKAMEEGDPDEADEQQERAKEKLAEAQQDLEEERDRYMDLRQEELLFKIKEELTQFLEVQRPITLATIEAAEKLAEGKRLSRPMRRKLNGLGENEGELASKVEFIRTALQEESVLVFSHILKSNEDDLRELAKRLSGRRPEANEYTVILQQDVEARTVQLLEALERERKRREEEKKKEKEEKQGENQFGPQKKRLVPILAELKMLKRMEEEMIKSTEALESILDASGADGISELDTQIAERLANRHNAITEIFGKVKQQLEQALSPPKPDESSEEEEAGKEKKGK